MIIVEDIDPDIQKLFLDRIVVLPNKMIRMDGEVFKKGTHLGVYDDKRTGDSYLVELPNYPPDLSKFGREFKLKTSQVEIYTNRVEVQGLTALLWAVRDEK